jgi:hypothetical protein
MQHNNPFICGNPIPPDKLIGRNDELSKVAWRISTGQSTAITGPLHCGKTSILDYLRASQKQAELYGDKANQLIFCYSEANTLGEEADQVQFWDKALKPLQDDINIPKIPSFLSEAYQTCQEKQFGNHELEKFIARLGGENWQLVLMIDEFDALLHHPKLNSTEFFGGLRSLASQSKGALMLVIASNMPVSQLNKETQHFNPTGSPYFNFMRHIILAPLPDAEIDQLLHQGDIFFTEEDHRFVKNIAGGHPYLLQVAASSLWEIYEKGAQKYSLKRQQCARQELYDQVAYNMLEVMWQRWTENTQKEFVFFVHTYFEQQQIPLQPVDINKLLEIKFDQMIPKEKKSLLNELKQSGLVAQEGSDGWRGFPNIFLDFVIENQLWESCDKQPREDSQAVHQDDDILEKLFTPTFLILMFMGTIVGERLGYFLTHEDFGILSIFSGESPLLVNIIKFCGAMLGGFLGYKLASKMSQIKKA